MPEPLPSGNKRAVGAILYDWPYGGQWWQDTVKLIREWNGSAEKPPSSSGGGIGTLPIGGAPYARYDSEGRKIMGEVVVVSSLPNNGTAFNLPQAPQSEGFSLKVINNTDKAIYAMFPQVFTYYGNPVYGQPQQLGGKIFPNEAGIYRVIVSGQGKMIWEWGGAANRILS